MNIFLLRIDHRMVKNSVTLAYVVLQIGLSVWGNLALIAQSDLREIIRIIGISTNI